MWLLDKVQKNNETEDTQESINNGLWQSALPEVKETLWHKETIDNIYKRLEQSEIKETKDVLSVAANKWIFYTISSNILDKLTNKNSYWETEWEQIFTKNAETIFNSIFKKENIEYFSVEHSDYIQRMIMINNQDEKIEKTDEKIEKTDEKIEKTEEDNRIKKILSKKSIETKINIEEEQTEIEEEQTEIEEEQTGIGDKIDSLNSTKTAKKWIELEKKQALLKKIISLRGLQSKISKNIKTNSTVFEQFKKKQLEKNPDLEQKLSGKWINQKEYLQFLYTAKKIANKGSKEDITPEEKEFIQKFEQTNKDLGIDIKLQEAYFFDDQIKNEKRLMMKSTSITSMKEIPDTAIIENDSVQKFLESDRSNDEALSFDFPKEDIKDILTPYAENDSELKKLLEHNIDLKGNIVIKSNNPLEVAQIKEKIEKILESYKKNMKEKTERIAKERVMTTCFKSLVWYFDITNANMENFADMEIDTDKWIDMKKQTMSISGSIKWKHVWLHYNLATWTVEMDDFMAYSQQENWYVMWKWTGMKKTMEFTLPTYDSLLSDASSVDVSDIAKKSDNINNFETNLALELDTKISSNFGDEAFTKFFVERELEKNLLEQEIIWDIFSNRNKNNKDVEAIKINNQRPIRIDETDPRYKLLRLIDNTLKDTKNSNELLKFRNSLNEFDKFINKKEIREWKSKDPELNNLFNKKSMESSMENRKQKNKEDKTRNNKDLNYYSFFNLMTKPSKTWATKIDINKFNLLIERMDNNKTLADSIDNPNKKEWNKITDKSLEKDLENIA